MPANINPLTAAIDALTAQVAETETVEASAVAVINGFAEQVTAAVSAALEADNAADNASITAATNAIETTRARFASSAALLKAVATTPSTA
jgi:hypothetical protein